MVALRRIVRVDIIRLLLKTSLSVHRPIIRYVSKYLSHVDMIVFRFFDLDEHNFVFIR